MCPDIAMCSTGGECAIATKCYRSEWSGTKPSGDRQSWMAFPASPVGCADFIAAAAPEPTPSQRAACMFAKTQADASGRPQVEVNAIVRETLIDLEGSAPGSIEDLDEAFSMHYTNHVF